MAQSLESKFVSVGDHSLNLCDIAVLVGKYIKYYVRKSMPVTCTPGPVNPWSDQEPFYPQCIACQDREKISSSKKRKETLND